MPMTSADDFVSQGMERYRGGDIAAAAAAYRLALCMDPASANAFHLLSICEIQLDRIEPALSCFRRLEAIGLRHEAIESNRRVAVQKASAVLASLPPGKALAEAASLAGAVLALDPGNPVLAFLFGGDDIDRGFVPRGLHRIAAVPADQRRRPPLLDAYNRIIVAAYDHGAGLLNGGKPVEALLTFAALAVLEPGHGQIASTLASAIRRTLREAVERHQSADLTGAVAFYDAILAAVPGHPEASHLRRLADWRRGSWRPAGRTERPAPSLAPSTAHPPETSPPVLTICIPTYNRPDELVFQVENLMAQVLESGRCDIRILVSDNCSDERVERSIRIFERWNRAGAVLFEYHRNAGNLGYDGNVMACFDRCVSGHIWILSDDDYVLPGTVARLCAVIDAHSPTLIFLNEPREMGGVAVDGTLTTPAGTMVRLPLGRPLSLDAGDEQLRAAVVSHSFWLSRSVFRKSFRDYDAADLYGTSVAHIGLVNLSLVNDRQPTLYLTDQPMVMNMPHSVFSHNFIEVFVSGMHRLYGSPTMNFSPGVVRAVARENFRFLERFIDGTHPPHMTMRYRPRFFRLVRKKLEYGAGIGETLRFARDLLKYRASFRIRAGTGQPAKSTSI